VLDAQQQRHRAIDTTTTTVTVRDGAATVTARAKAWCCQGQTVGGGARLDTGDPLPAEQNLVRNGDFSQRDRHLAARYAPAVDPNEQVGTADVATDGGRHIVHISRDGGNWGHVGRTQMINRDVQGLTSLRLSLDIQGMGRRAQLRLQGTECPLMVKIVYVDVGGGTHEWLQASTVFRPNRRPG